MSASEVKFDTVAIGSGHMIDAPDRPEPRFPAAKVEAVRTEIAQQLARWEIGARDLAICGGACGADLLFAEECLRRDPQVRLLLAEAVDDFVRNSVRPAGEDWVRRFHAVREKAEVEILSVDSGDVPNDTSIYGRTNLWMIETARAEAARPEKICALLVWDEKSTGDGPGGTSDFEAKVRRLGGQITIINPTRLA